MLRIYITDTKGLRFGNIKDYPFVSEVRRKKVLGYKNQKDALLSLGIEICLNKAIRDLEENISLPVNYSYDRHGRPFLIDLPYSISFSHSGSISVVAISSDRVGVDIQLTHDVPFERLSKRYFSKEEREYVNSLRSFFEVWTLKEAYTKYLGLGLLKNFKSFTVYPASSNEHLNIVHNYVPLGKGYKLCVVSAKDEKIERFII